MEKKEAAYILDVKEAEIAPFIQTDYYNGNEVEGYLCRRSDYRYGALVIYKVNGTSVPIQKIFCTPKLHYPFGTREDETRCYTVKDYQDLVVYEKLDGTNICCFSYSDGNKRYVSFKTRLTPFLKANKYADFVTLWDSLLKSNLGLRSFESVESGEYSLSFEMYGYKNPLAITYSVPLDTKFLFAIKQSDCSIIPPKYFLDKKAVSFCLPEVWENEDDKDHSNFIEVYESCRKYATDKTVKREDGMYDGLEGFIFYTLIDGVWNPLKCKSAQMEDHSWSQGGITYPSIYTTAWNALESCEGELTVDYVKELLLEEYSHEQIERASNRVEKAVYEVLSKLAFRKRVLDIYDKIEVKFDGTNKGLIMRTLSSHFGKKEMCGVYNALKETGIL